MSNDYYSENPKLRSIPGCPGYLAGDDGSIWSTRNKYGKGGLGGELHRLIAFPRSRTSRRLVVTIQINCKSVQRSVPELVLLAFVGPRPTDGCYDVCHFPNKDPADNRLSNLRYDTRTNNHLDKVHHGTDNRGEKNNTAKLHRDDVRKIRQRAAKGERWIDICNDYPQVTKSAVWNIIKRKTWRWLDAD